MLSIHSHLSLAGAPRCHQQVFCDFQLNAMQFRIILLRHCPYLSSILLDMLYSGAVEISASFSFSTPCHCGRRLVWPFHFPRHIVAASRGILAATVAVSI